METCARRTAPTTVPGAPPSAWSVRWVRRWLPAGEREATHYHSFVELCHVQSGRGVMHLGNKTLVAAADTVTIVSPDVAHGLAADSGWTCAVHQLHFLPEAVRGDEGRQALAALLRAAAAGHATIVLRAKAGHGVAPLLLQVGALAGRPEVEDACGKALGELCRALWRQLWESRASSAGPAGSRAHTLPALPHGVSPPSRREIEHVLAYIENNLNRPISRDELARQAAFAPSYFSALFREATGTTIPEYINARRVHRAQELLRDPHTRVSAVCYAVGFRDLSNFNRVFKRLVGCTPREYRQSVLGYDDGADGDGCQEPNG